jgi:RND family efflux transporter MFP subunit
MMLGAAGLVLAAAVAGGGALVRAINGQALASAASEAAIPTVALAKVDYSAAGGALNLPGAVQPLDKAAIYARVSGYLKDWRADIGANVKAGQTLAVIDTPDLDQQLDQAKADLASAKANQALAELTARRWQALVSSQAVAQQAADEKTSGAVAAKALMDAAAANVRRLETLAGFKRIVAPFDGVVTARNTDIGALINAGAATGGTGQALFEVSDLRRVRIYVQAPQSFAAMLRPGLKAVFDLPQYPGRSFTATLTTTSDALRAGSDTLQVELQADNADHALQGGAYCRVHFQLPSQTQAARIPATALAPIDQGAKVAIVGPDGRAAFRTIQLGRDFGDNVEVVAGLMPSDRVIDNPPETLQAGDLVRVAAPGGKPGAAL